MSNDYKKVKGIWGDKSIFYVVGEPCSPHPLGETLFLINIFMFPTVFDNTDMLLKKSTFSGKLFASKSGNCIHFWAVLGSALFLRFDPQEKFFGMFLPTQKWEETM